MGLGIHPTRMFPSTIAIQDEATKRWMKEMIEVLDETFRRIAKEPDEWHYFARDGDEWRTGVDENGDWALQKKVSGTWTTYSTVES
jgi:hypothetical protein